MMPATKVKIIAKKQKCIKRSCQKSSDETISGSGEPRGIANVFDGNGNDIIANYSANTEAHMTEGTVREIFFTSAAVTTVVNQTPREDKT